MELFHESDNCIMMVDVSMRGVPSGIPKVLFNADKLLAICSQFTGYR